MIHFFIRERCCHRKLCLHLIEPHWRRVFVDVLATRIENVFIFNGSIFLSAMLTFCYTGHIVLNEANVPELLHLSNAYGSLHPMVNLFKIGP